VFLAIAAPFGLHLPGEIGSPIDVLQPDVRSDRVASLFLGVIAVRTAKSLGLEVPDKLLAIADEVIE
jgi:hypothetical protein